MDKFLKELGDKIHYLDRKELVRLAYKAGTREAPSTDTLIKLMEKRGFIVHKVENYGMTFTEAQPQYFRMDE